MFDEVLKNAENLAEQKTNITEIDFKGSDGLIYCGLCHTAKQVTITIQNAKKTVFCLCECEQRKQQEFENKLKQEQEKEDYEQRKEACFGESSDKTASFENAEDNEYVSAAKKYAEQFEMFRQQGKGLLLYGDVGTGKTFISACIANKLLKKGYKVLMTTFSRIEKTATSQKNTQQYYDSLNDFDLLIIDDYKSERSTEYMLEVIYSVIDSRMTVCKPLIVTSNVSNDELKNPSSVNLERIYSRLTKICHPIFMKGSDRRKQKAIEEFKEINKILGV